MGGDAAVTMRGGDDRQVCHARGLGGVAQDRVLCGQCAQIEWRAGASCNTMRIVVLGGSGLIGSKLVSLLRQEGHDVVAASHASGG